MNRKLLAIFASAALLFAAGCAKDKDKAENQEPEKQEEQQVETTDKVGDVYENKVFFTIEMTDGGIMKGELYPDLAPITVENFVKLVEDKFYDGLIFHRVIPGFMIQGGGYNEEMKEKPADSIKGEFSSNGVENDLKHVRGVISMARTPEPDSASSQFFIMHQDSPHLDGDYAAFGKITEGLDIIDEIATVETTVFANVMGDFPVEPQIIKTITIDK